MTIKQKQWQLFYLGYYGESTSDIDGYWGPKSEEGTIAFQRAVGITDDGIFGKHTCAKSKELIAAIQDVIAAYAKSTLVEDGLAGPATMAATVWYQKAIGITPTGIADVDTRSHIQKDSNAPQSVTADAKAIWDFLIEKIGNPFGVAGLMGNLFAESCLIPNNLQNTYNTRLGYDDKEYTEAVDNGIYKHFVDDSAGYGLAQWTYHTRKKALLEFAKEQNASVGNLSMQLNFLYKELSENFSGVLKTLKSADTILEASNAVLLKFECPADQSSTVQTRRATYGQKYYDLYAVVPPVAEKEPDSFWDEIEYFTRNELRCKCGGKYCDGFPAEPKEMTVRLADRARKHFGRPAHNVSFLRCKTWNAKSGGVANSQHMYGEAMDIRIDGVSGDELYEFFLAQPEVRYTYKINSTNVHFDIPKGAR